MASGTTPSAPILLAPYGDPSKEPPTLTNAAGTTACRSGCGPMDWNPAVLLRIVGSHVVVQGVRFVGVTDLREEGCADQGVGNHTGVWFEGSPDSIGSKNELLDSDFTGLSRGVVVGSSARQTRIRGNTFRNNSMMLVLDGAQFNDGGAVGIQLQGNDNEIDGNRFSGQDGCSYDYLRDGSAVEVWGSASGNHIHHNRAFDNESFVELGKPGEAEPPTDNTVAYNVVVGTRTEGDGQAFLTTRGAASRYGPVHRTLVVNNSVHMPGSRARGIVCDSGCSSQTLTAANNIIWSDGDGTEGHHGAIICDGACTERTNLVWSGDSTPHVRIDGEVDPGRALGTGSLVADPRWLAPEQGDLRLQAGSPAIDAGTLLSGQAYDVDLAGETVPAGAQVDMGAFEGALEAGQRRVPPARAARAAVPGPDRWDSVATIFRVRRRAGL